MKSIKSEDFTDSFFARLEETFEGTPKEQPGFYLDTSTSLFSSVQGLTADHASISLGQNEATIAAHLNHLRFYFRVLMDFVGGNTKIVSWSDSWKLKEVNDEEWSQLRTNVRKQYEAMKEMLKDFDDWDGKRIGAALAIVVHSSYHLGAIRQIIKTI